MSNSKKSPLELDEKEFKEIGYQLVDSIAELIDTLPRKPLTTKNSLEQLRKKLEKYSMDEENVSAKDLLSNTTELLVENSLFNGHPKFMGFITSAPSPIGILGDFLSSAINANVSAQILSPISTEIEKQTIQWLCDLIGLDSSYGGLLVSGGNMANFTGFLAARTSRLSGEFKNEGLSSLKSNPKIYCSKATHTWIEKASVLFGHGLSSLRWIETNHENKMDTHVLEKTIQEDLKAGQQPFMVVGTAGDVSTGIVDALDTIADICEKYNLWFHIDGAYGAPVAALPEYNETFKGLNRADSVALDPHKWLYAPLEAGCILVKDSSTLRKTFSSRPEYYNFNGYKKDEAHNFYEYGMQNSRGFRALKVWLMLQHTGRKGIVEAIRQDIDLSKLLYDLAKEHKSLEVFTHNLSITTLRFVPEEFKGVTNSNLDYLNKLNEELLHSIQYSGELFLSNAIIDNKFSLRACIVNFKTSEKDIREGIELIVEKGNRLHHQLS